MTDIRLVEDEFGRQHPVKVEDLFQYGIEADGDTIATGVLKVKHVVFEQFKDADNVGTGMVAVVDLPLPPGCSVYRYAWRTDTSWTTNDEVSSCSIYLGTPDTFDDIIANADATNGGDGNTGQSIDAWYQMRPNGVTMRMTVYAPAEHPDYQGGRTWISFWYSVPTDTVDGNSATWQID